MIPGPHCHVYPGVRGERQAAWFEGDYREHELDRKRRPGAEADQPHRIHYKRLMRA